MSERELVEWMIESWVDEHVANLLAEAAFAEKPPRALTPPEILFLDASINTTMCMIYSDIMEDFFENSTELACNDASKHESEDVFEANDQSELWGIVCPVCMESTSVSNNMEAGLFILCHQTLHQYESNGAVMRAWDEGTGDTGQAGDRYGK